MAASLSALWRILASMQGLVTSQFFKEALIMTHGYNFIACPQDWRRGEGWFQDRSLAGAVPLPGLTATGPKAEERS
jgi:hypothetical protein